MNNEGISVVHVSILLPVLNSVRYIRECIDTILAQKLKEIELICIDAGSTDGTFEIIKEYALADVRVHIIKSDQKSYGYQLNRGICQARGKYIGIVESDDHIDAELFWTLYLYAEQNQFPDFVKGGYLRFVEWKGKRYFENCNRKKLQSIYGKLIRLSEEREKGMLDLNHIWSGIYRRDFLKRENIRLNESPGASYQDLGFSLLVGLLADTGVFIEENLYYYRTDNTESSVRSPEKWDCVIHEYHYVIHELEKRGLDSWKMKKLVLFQKPSSYLWNISRLPEREKKLFFKSIQEELSELKSCPKLYKDLNDDQNAILELLRSEQKLNDYFDSKQKLICKFKSLIAMIQEGKKFVLVSAGAYGKRILFLQDIIDRNYIEAVADNDIERQGKNWNGYVLLSITEAVQQYAGDYFLIANRNSSETIKNTLIQSEITETKILIFDDMLPLNEMIQLI